ncbi:MAG: NADP-dependent oxidoreductase [Burkholderiales bacterium]|nr:NADP-dependent oxidoreductase [Burkholderiales bacterium]
MTARTMKAVRIHGYGGPEVLRYEDAPVPAIAPDEVLVEVRCAGVNPIDWQVREGRFKDGLGHRLPLILGWDVAGVVAEAGSAANGFAPGDRVYARAEIGRDGAYAEYIAVKAHDCARKPERMAFAAAAGVPLAALAAWKALFDEGGLKSGQTVLVHGAAGGVGSFAVQLAKAFHCVVVAATSTANVEMVKALGADRVVDYGHQDFAATVRDVDVVLDTLGGEMQARSWAVLREGGTLVSLVSPPDPQAAAGRRVAGRYAQAAPDGARLHLIGGMIDAGRLRTVIDTVLPLAQAAAAHGRSASGRARGKIILAVKND